MKLCTFPKKSIFSLKNMKKHHWFEKILLYFFFPPFFLKSHVCVHLHHCVTKKRVYMIVIDHKSRLTSIIVEKKIYIFFFSRVEIDNFFFFFTRMGIFRTNIGIYGKLQKNTFVRSTKKNPNHIFFCKQILISFI